MTLFANPRSKRRIASTMLAFWLFALGAGWANACVLQERGTHGHTADAIAAGAPTVSPGHVGVVDDHTADSPLGKAPCLKVCDDSTKSFVKWHSGIDLPDLALLPPVAMPWPMSLAAHDAPQADRNEQPARARLPLRTRYSRLAL